MEISAEDFLLTPESLRGYLAERGLVKDPSQLAVRELGGGVSNVVLLVEGPHGQWVAKQSLEKLRVEDDWRSSRDRIFREAAAIELLRPVLGATLPRLVHINRKKYLYIMTAAPNGSTVWKQLLLDGEISLEIARQAGNLLAKIITASQANEIFKETFSDRTVFDELRVDPYYRTTAMRDADARKAIQRLIDDSWAIRTSLVHGDYSPKNMLVRGDNIFLIDFEVVHWGDPAFDAAFLLNHLMLKAFHRPGCTDRYFEAAREFWKALAGCAGEAAGPRFEIMTVRHLGGLMLARIDGKSPVEYIQDDNTKTRIRRAARKILLDTPDSLEQAWANLHREIVHQ